MTWKAGDAVNLPVYLESNAGVPATYASWSAFLAAGWTAIFYQGTTALDTQPTITVAPVTSGWHNLAFTLPAGVDSLIITPPAGFTSTPATMILIVPTNDTDSLTSFLAAAVGGSTSTSQTQAFDFTTIEGDNFAPITFTIPLTALRVLDTSSRLVYQYADLTDIGGQPWTIAASARGAWNRAPASAVSYDFAAVIPDKANRIVAIGFPTTVPAGAIVCNSDGSADTAGAQTSTSYAYDIQLKPPVGSTYAGIRLTVVAGTHTITRQQTTS